MTYSAVNTIWVLVGAALVFFMQAGFAMCEAGFTRAKNTGNILMKNLMDFCIGTPVFWLVGFGLMFGGSGAFIGGFDPLVLGDYSSMLPSGVPLAAFLIFQTVFCATAATIVSGAMAERTKFVSYCIYSLMISLVIYPISGHWVWGGGWLSQLGFHDFAGSTAVHMVGGTAALVGAKILGPRIGKYDEKGKPRAILGHNLPIAALGVFILWFCWFGFNGCSTVAMGTILTGFLSVDQGLLYGHGASFLGVQVLGVVSVMAWVVVTMTVVFTVIKLTIGLRASQHEEIEGLDPTEHGLATAYAGFAITETVASTASASSVAPVAAAMDEAIPVQVRKAAATPASDVKLSKVTIVCNASRFEALKAAMARIGVTGMTVAQVQGCGVQKGKTEYYRGVPMTLNLLPKLQVDIVVSKVPVSKVIEAAQTSLYTGHIGDGKIFVYDVEQVVRVRTGETGFDALQGDE